MVVTHGPARGFVPFRCSAGLSPGLRGSRRLAFTPTKLVGVGKPGIFSCLGLLEFFGGLAVSSLSVVAPGFPPVCGGPDGWRLPRRSWSGSGSPASSLAILLRMPFNRKNIRLAPQNYLGYGTYFVTICSNNRNPHFAGCRSLRFKARFLRSGWFCGGCGF